MLLALLAAGALLVGADAVRRALDEDGSIDLHAYWYCAHFLWQGREPYTSWARGDVPDVPARYLDGPADGDAVARPGLAIAPTNTAPLLLVLAPLATLSWPAAKVVWLAFNLALALVVPALVLRLLPGGRDLPLPWRAFIVLAFLLLQGTRISIWVGQTAPLVVAAMLVALLVADRRPVGAGLALGLALSKYTLALPAVLVLLAARRFRVVGVACAVQIGGIVAVSVLGHSSALDVLAAYGALARLHAGFPGIHLASLVPGRPWLTAGGAAILTVLLAGGWLRLARGRGDLPPVTAVPALATSLPAFHLLAATVPWSLVVVYHRSYDTLQVILPVALAVLALAGDARWDLRRRERRALGIAAAVFLAVLCLPSSLAELVLPAAWVPGWYVLASAAITVGLVASVPGLLWLTSRLSLDPSRR